MSFDNQKAIWPISLAQIEKTVAAHLGPGRVPGSAAGPCLSRQVSMYLAKHVGGWSLRKIGRFYNGRHHTTVLHAIAKMERLRKTDEAWDSLIDVLTATLTSGTTNCRTGRGVSSAHSELIDAVATRVIHRLTELIPERREQADSNATVAQLGPAKPQERMAGPGTDSARQPGV